MLPICKAFGDSGYPIIVRSAQNNPKNKHAMLEQHNDRQTTATGAPNDTLATTPGANATPQVEPP